MGHPSSKMAATDDPNTAHAIRSHRTSKLQKNPVCVSCGGRYHIQNDPMNAYNGVGIFCELCGKNREDNPEMLLETHYYQCESCQMVDICSHCYLSGKRKLPSIKEWMIEHKVLQHHLLEVLSMHIISSGSDLPEQVLRKTTQSVFDRIVRRVRVDALSMLRENQERLLLDKLLLRFERIWR